MKPRQLVTRPFRALLRSVGYDVVPRDLAAQSPGLPSDFTGDDAEDFRFAAPYTMVPPERIYTLVRAVEYVVEHDVPGALVECGTWKGGCAMTMARALERLGATDRELHLFDLFGEMWPAATEHDVHLGIPELERNAHITEVPENMRYTVDEVRRRVLATGYPGERVYFAKGRVEETLPAQAPEQVALLRLDTDFYESTRHELTHLYPRLAQGGVLIIDDYGDWAGSRKATDEYIEAHDLPLHLIRVDVGARMAVKPHSGKSAHG